MTYRYKAYQLANMDKNPELQTYVSQEEIEDMKVVAHVLPHKVNNYYNQQIIDWENYKFDPGFRLVYPQKEMLPSSLFDIVKDYLETFSDKEEQKIFLNSIRLKLNPHPAGQKTHNVPIMDGLELHSLQHKYAETLLVFPYHAKTCAAYCQMCFRWPLFVNDEAMKFTLEPKINIQMDVAVEYIRRHPEITNVLITGGDPMVIAPKLLRQYVRPLHEAKIPHLQAIRIGSKQLSYQPYTFTQGKKAQQILQIFRMN